MFCTSSSQTADLTAFTIHRLAIYRKSFQVNKLKRKLPFLAFPPFEALKLNVYLFHPLEGHQDCQFDVARPLSRRVTLRQKRNRMRVIGGTARGVSISAPKGKGVRPTLDRVREALFNILAHRIVDADFLDLFAGTGANGIEALSRGARSAVFVDHSRISREVIEENLRKTKLADKGRTRADRLPDGLRKVAKDCQDFDIIFADPPYDFAPYSELLRMIAECKLLKGKGLVVVEHDKKKGMEEAVDSLCRTKIASYGDSSLSFYEYTDE